MSANYDACTSILDHGGAIFRCWPGGTDVTRPNGWQTTIPGNRAGLDTFKQGDALATVTGLIFDVIDVDSKAGASPADLPPFKSYGTVRTPSGGWHFYIPATGLDPFIPIKGVDFQSSGRNVFLPGSTRPKYPGGAYTWETPLDLDALLDADVDPDLLEWLEARLPRRAPAEIEGPAEFKPSPWVDVASYLADRDRNIAVFGLARSLEGRGMGEAAALGFMRDLVWPMLDQHRPTGPFTAEEFEHEVRRAFRPEMRRELSDSPEGVDPETGEMVPAVSGPVARRAAELRVEEQARRLVRLERAGVRPQASLLDGFLDIPDEPATYRVEGVLPVGGRAVFSAQYKAGKTTAVANLLRALVDGEPFLGQYAVTPFTGRVVLIDNELDERMLRRWLREQGITNTHRVAVLPLRGKVGHFDLVDDANRAQWATDLRALDARVVILDCLRPVLDALGLNENGEAGIFLTAFDALLTEAGAGEAVVTHHMGHTGERSRGDTRIRDWPDVEWTLVRESDDKGEQNADARRYFRAYGRDVDQAEQLLTYDPTTRKLLIGGGSRKDTAADGVIPELIDYLRDNPGATQRGIESALTDHTRAMVRSAIGKAVDSGRVLREPGPRNSIRHSINPSAPSVPGVRQHGVSECASAPIGRAAHTHAEDTQLATAHSTHPSGESVVYPSCDVCGFALVGIQHARECGDAA